MLIKPALTNSDYNPPARWSSLPHGNWLRAEEQRALQPYWPTMGGQYVLELGALSNGVTAGCKATTRINICGDEDAMVQARLDALPVRKRCIDIAVLAHVLEYQRDPHQILREADRTLAFDGYMVLTLYNPLSLSALGAAWPGLRKEAPWRGRFFHRQRVQDWLQLLNYEVIGSGYVGNALLWPRQKPPGWGPAKVLKQLPLLRCCYYIIARKRVFPMKLQPAPIALRKVPATADIAQAGYQNKYAKKTGGKT